MEGVCGFGVGLPITEKGSLFHVSWDEVVSHNSDATSSWSNVLLGSSIDNSVLIPIDNLTAEVGRHIRDKDLAFWNLVIWEFFELKSLNGFVVTIVEEFRVTIDFPVSWFCDSGVARILVVGDLVSCAEFGCLFDSSLRPCASCKVVGNLSFTVSKKIVADSRELHRCSTLEEKDCEVVWDAK